MIRGLVKYIFRFFVLLVCTSLIFIGYKANQPMSVPEAPKGMTYVEFIQDRIDAATTVEPSRCGWGMMISLATLGPIYSVVYTEVAIHPGGFLEKYVAPDSNIPVEAAGANWYEVPSIWWNVVEQLSWTMVGEPTSQGCQFRDVKSPITDSD
ncbi:MAG: hypothetical protein JEZ00_11405 [Anaerolineaceae bacterium]|nr:hypothetical protein [Anaerolineaceae bacterium]